MCCYAFFTQFSFMSPGLSITIYLFLTITVILYSQLTNLLLLFKYMFMYFFTFKNNIQMILIYVTMMNCLCKDVRLVGFSRLDHSL